MPRVENQKLMISNRHLALEEQQNQDDQQLQTMQYNLSKQQESFSKQLTKDLEEMSKAFDGFIESQKEIQEKVLPAINNIKEWFDEIEMISLRKGDRDTYNQLTKKNV